MRRLRRTLILGAVLLAGCGTTRNVAVSSYHVTRDVAVGSYRVATAPVHYAFRRHGGESDTAMTTQTVPSDINQPGQPVPPPEVVQQPRSTRERPQSTSASAPQTGRRENTSSKPSSQRKVSSPKSEFPTAKAVPGKPGYVFSPFDTDKRYVDVSGYASGSKVKDPWTDKIFVVP
ncbi:MAG TPA: hypothetical protein VKH14_09145 [Candidatus Udaeobacter sp.]|nr:hypothetical protein [Candidatus Udaeobacter sp.]